MKLLTVSSSVKESVPRMRVTRLAVPSQEAGLQEAEVVKTSLRLEEASGQPSGAVVTSQSASTRPEENQTFAPPDDIPSGRDDDVVARQIREAAMSEPDPELREALWDEYRNYTGIGEEQ